MCFDGLDVSADSGRCTTRLTLNSSVIPIIEVYSILNHLNFKVGFLPSFRCHVLSYRWWNWYLAAPRLLLQMKTRCIISTCWHSTDWPPRWGMKWNTSWKVRDPCLKGDVTEEPKRACIEPNFLNDCRLEWTGSRKPARHIWWERVGGMCDVYNEILLPVKETLWNSTSPSPSNLFSCWCAAPGI